MGRRFRTKNIFIDIFVLDEPIASTLKANLQEISRKIFEDLTV